MYRKVIVTTLLVFFGNVCLAGELEVFQSGEPITAGGINGNFSEIENRSSSTQAQVDANEARISALEQAESGVGENQSKLTVFSSTDIFPVGQGRRAMNASCEAMDARARFCTVQEIGNSLVDGGLKYGVLAQKSWLDSAANSRNCSGFTSTAVAGGVNVLTSKGHYDDTGSCSLGAALPATCCF